MKVSSEILINDLIERTRQNINQAEKFNQSSIENLNWRSNPESWSVLECIEHLNLYGDFYLPELERCINQSSPGKDEYFKPGLLGDYFAKSMMPKEKLNKMKTFKDKNPIGHNLNQKNIEQFIIQQQKTLELLNKARNISLNKTRASISISKWIKLKLGDTFRFLIYHNERHIAQANSVLKSISKS